MDELNDEAIQRLLEEERLSGGAKLSGRTDSEDIAAYQYLFDELKKDLPDALSPRFSDKVINQLQTQKSHSEETLFYIILSVGAILAFGLGFVLFTISGNYEVHILLDTFSPTKVWFAFGLSFLFLFQLLDQKLVKKTLLGGRKY